MLDDFRDTARIYTNVTARGLVARVYGYLHVFFGLLYAWW